MGISFYKNLAAFSIGKSHKDIIEKVDWIMSI